MATKTRIIKSVHNLETRNSSSVDSRRKSSFGDKPTPLDFDSFIPWVCMEWQLPEVVEITRLNQEKLTRRSSSAKSKATKSIRVKESNESTSKKEYTSATNTIKSSQVDNVIPISAYYDSQGHLAEIAIVMCASEIHRKVIQAISLCVPFHSFLTKLIIRKGCLGYLMLHELGKLLPHSNLTDVCLDDTNVPDGNFYVLLEQTSNMKYLSLNRCKINDEICKEIASRIDFGRPAEKSLMMLNLSSNIITDAGAKHFGDILRRNRHLLHLNLSGNRIGDIGLRFLVEHLQEFSLSSDEVRDKKLRKMEYCRRRNEVYEYCMEEVIRLQKSEGRSVISEKRSSFTIKPAKFKQSKKTSLPLVTEEPSRTDIATKMTLEIIGELIDPFDDDKIFKRDDQYYSTGNLKLCSLNVAFNNIEFPSLLKILEVLRYQCLLEKHSFNTGLLRIVLDGNYLPDECPELERIGYYLKEAIASQVPVYRVAGEHKRRTSRNSGKQPHK